MQEGLSSREIRPDDDALRHKRRLAMVHRRRRIRFAVVSGAVCLVIVVVVIVAVAASRNSGQISSEEMLAGGTRSPTAPISATREARPAFARFGDRNLLLPVAAGDATIIAYQAVSNDSAVALTPIGQQVNANAFVRFFRGLFSGEPSVRYYVLAGEEGEPTTSVLVGASPDSMVTSPVSGVVTGVKEYLLFGKYDDVQIDIRPEETGGITVSLLFISNPTVTIGEPVTAGKTQLGTVRRCPEEMGKTLAQYTHDSGSHVYLQVTEEPIG